MCEIKSSKCKGNCEKLFLRKYTFIKCKNLLGKVYVHRKIKFLFPVKRKMRHLIR